MENWPEEDATSTQNILLEAPCIKELKVETKLGLTVIIYLLQALRLNESLRKLELTNVVPSKIYGTPSVDAIANLSPAPKRLMKVLDVSWGTMDKGTQDYEELLRRASHNDWEEDIRMRLLEEQFVKRLYNFVFALQSMGRVSPGPNNPDSNPNLSVQEKKDILIELLGL